MKNAQKTPVAVCWDVDGVLVDTEPLHQEKLVTVAAAHNAAITDADWPQLQGIGDKRVWEWLCANRGLQITQQQFLQECEEYFLSHPEKIVPRKGAREAFNHFAAKQLPQGAVSSGIRQQVDTNLDIADVRNKMLFALSADEVKKTKPDPEPYLLGIAHMCNAMGWDASQADHARFIAIEDSIPGVTSAKSAGLTTILWAQTPGKTCKEADYVCYTEQELMAVIQSLTAPVAKPATQHKKSNTQKFGT